MHLFLLKTCGAISFILKSLNIYISHILMSFNPHCGESRDNRQQATQLKLPLNPKDVIALVQNNTLYNINIMRNLVL